VFEAPAEALEQPFACKLALELGAAFSVVLVRAVNADRVAHVAHADETGASALTVDSSNREEGAPPKSAPRGAQKRVRRRRDDNDDQDAPRKRGLAGLLDTMQAGGSVVSLSQRKLARQIGVSRRTLERAMRDLAEAGALVMEAGKAGTRLALA
jgi:Crp-like helix-turn-helix protein